MTTLVVKSLTGSGKMTIDSSPLGKGGEGSVFVVNSHNVPGLDEASSLVAKIYHKPHEGDRINKIKAMVVSKPDTDSVAWPVAVLYDSIDGSFVGYAMKKLDSENFRQWAELSNTKDRRATSPDFDVKYALVACRNLAAAIESVHKSGHKVGDINESNIFVKADASVLLVDTDSAQIQSKSGEIFPCLVGKPEYTAPEISRGSLKDNPRTTATDVFAFAVAVYQMLTGGAHPTDGIYNGAGDPPGVMDKMRSGIYPGLDPSVRGFSPVPRVPSECIPSRVASYLLEALSVYPSARLSLYEFIQIIDETLQCLQHCKKITTHWYDARDGGCPWCARGELPDPWGPTKPSVSNNGTVQKTLPSVSFSSGDNSAPVVRRVAPVVSSSQSRLSQPPQNSHYSGGNNSHKTPPQKSHYVSSGPHSVPNTGFYSGINQQVHQTPVVSKPEEPKIPNKIKGKTVLTYTDGTYGPRPKLGTLMRHNPKLAFFCIRNETPLFAHAVWGQRRPVASLWGLIVGLILGQALAGVLRITIPLLIPLLDNLIPFDIALMVVTTLAQVSMITASMAAFVLFFSGLADRIKSNKSGKSFKQDNGFITVLRFIPIVLVYGPFLVVFVVGLIAYLLILFIAAVFNNTK